MAIRDEIMAFGAALDEALISNDAAAVARFFHDDWVYVDPAGITSKAELIEWIASGRLAHHTMATIGTPRVIAYGDAAISTARRTTTGSWEGTGYATDEWMTEVYIRTGESWQCVITQKCPAGTAGLDPET